MEVSERFFPNLFEPPPEFIEIAGCGKLDKVADQARTLREWFRGFVRKTLLLGEMSRNILPSGVFNVLAGGNELGQRLVQHPE